MGKTLHLSESPALEVRVDVPETPFVLFVAADVSADGDEGLRAFARRLLDRGAVAVATWGPGCERLHDAFDAENRDLEDSGLVMTTWHANEPLAEALSFAATYLVPDEHFVAVTAFCAVVAGDRELAERVRVLLIRPGDLF